MVSKTVLVDGISMRWEEHGDGFPVVLVHGIPTSPALWRHLIPMIDGQALAWEMVGYGHSIPEGRGRDISVPRPGTPGISDLMRRVSSWIAVLKAARTSGGISDDQEMHDP